MPSYSGVGHAWRNIAPANIPPLILEERKKMSWSTIRRATEADSAAIEAAAQRFARRHNLDAGYGDTAAMAIDANIDCLRQPGQLDGGAYGRSLERLWRNCQRRALGEKNADGIAYGYVGFHVA